MQMPQLQLTSIQLVRACVEPPPESNRRRHPYHSCGLAPIEVWAQVSVTRVTVSDRQMLPVPALYGTQMARRPVRLNLVARPG
jgi:hypothetical protein